MRKSVLYIPGASLEPLAVMDKAFSILAFPVGLMICFTPMFIVWIAAEIRDSRATNKRNSKKG